MRSQRLQQSGFTLIELLMTLAIAGILAMIGAPVLSGLLARTHMSTAEARVADTLRHARAAAVMHNARVLACPSDDGKQCRPGYEWQNGWIVAPDVNGDGNADAGSAPLVVVAAMPSGTRVITSVGRPRLTFHPDGNAAGSNASFTICHARQKEGQSVVVSNSGRVRVGKPEPARLQACLAGLL